MPLKGLNAESRSIRQNRKANSVGLPIRFRSAENRRVNPKNVFICLLMVLPVGLIAQSAYPDTRKPAAWQVMPVDEYSDSEWLTLDRNEDGAIDYAVLVSRSGNKIHEAMDFNHDGLMDDFYIYENNVLKREEIDSNYDGKIDIWIYLNRGVYIRMWERDTDFDGVIDERTEYADEAE